MIQVEQTAEQKKYDNHVCTAYSYCDMVRIKDCGML